MQTIRGDLKVITKPHESDEIEIDGVPLSYAIERLLSPVSEGEKDGYACTSYGRVLIHFEQVAT